MKRIDTSTAVDDLFGAGKKGFRDGNEALGILATKFNADWVNQVQEEIANVIELNGIALDGGDRAQLFKAIKNMISGSDIIARFTTTGNIDLNGLATQAGGDWGGALTAGDVIFVKDQTAGAENGWYAAAAGAWARVVYLDESTEVKPSNLTKVSEGATLADTMWMLTTNAPITVGSTALVFEQKDGQEFASAAEVLAATITNKSVTPGVQHNHPSAAKAWVKFGPTGTILDSYNVSSVTRNALGDYTINFTVAFANANYVAVFSTKYVTNFGTAEPVVGQHYNVAPTVSAFRLMCKGWSSSAANDATIHASFYGDQ